MTSLQDFIADRLRQLDMEEAPLRERLQSITEEREQLRAAAAAAGIKLPDDSREIEKALEVLRRPSRRTIPEKTLKDAVVEVLRAKAGGMTALEILAAINLRFSADYPRTSLSPQLSRLKAEGKLIREGIVWRLPDQKQKSAVPGTALFD